MIVIHSTGGPTCDAATGKPIWVDAGTLDENMRHEISFYGSIAGNFFSRTRWSRTGTIL